MRDLDLKDHIATQGGAYCVSTVHLAIEHEGGMRYETYIFPSDGEHVTNWGEVWGMRYATREEAIAGHAQATALLRANELELLA